MSSPASANSVTRQIARAAGTVMVAFVISNLIGLLRGVLVYRAFGTGVELDSFNAANRVTELLYNLMAGGALGSAFIPTFTGFLTRDDRRGAWRLASGVVNLLSLALTLVCLLGMLFAPQIVRYGLFALDPGGSPGQEALTVGLLRVMLPTILIFGVSGLVMGALNANRVFWVPAVAPALYSIGQIIGLLFFPVQWGIYRLAWGVLFGSGLHLLVQIPVLIRVNFHYEGLIGWKIPEVREVFRLFAPRVLGVAAVQANFLVNTIIALGLQPGSTSAIAGAFTLMLMPEAAIAQSLAIASLPSFSAQVAQGRLEEMRASLASTLRGVLLLALPASVGLILLRTPLVRLLYENGAVFTEESTGMVAWALLWYAAGLVGHSVVEIVSRAFYALHDTRTPVIVTSIAMGLNIGFSFLFSRLFALWGWLPLGGLALANSLSAFLEMIGLLMLMRRRLGGLGGRALLGGLVQAASGSLLMAVGVLWWMDQTSTLVNWGIVLGAALIGISIYGLVLLALRVPELYALLGVVRRRLGVRA